MEWIALGVAVLALAYTVFFQPKQDAPKAATLEDFQIPTAEEGRTIPVLFGTRMISGANVVWYGNLDKKEIKK